MSSRVRAHNLSTNDADCIMQSRPWRQMENERAAWAFCEFKLDPRVESVQMDANHARCEATSTGREWSLIERGKPAVSDRHLVIGSERRC
jgi:hypothetical protein